MNNKKFFGAAITTIFSFVMAVTAANFSSISVKKASALGDENDAPYSEASFNSSIEIGRNELTIDIQSLTSTPTSKSATITFSSVSVTGWGTPKKNAYIVIDDPDYSGSESQPSLSDRTNPQFNGYTIEMSNAATFTLDYTVGETRVKITEFVIPQTVSYGNTFSIKNNKILSDAFVFEKGLEEAKFDRLVIPSGIEVIESKAFQNVPANVEVKICESSKPAGWADDWFGDIDPAKIEWNYQLVGKETTGRTTGNETNQLDQSIGTAKKTFGKLSNSAGNSANNVYTVVDDVNWTGDFDNPVRDGSSAPYALEGYVLRLIDNASAIYVPETMQYGSDLTIANTRIAAHALDFDQFDDNEQYIGNISEIYIPSGITEIESKAFTDVPASVTFKCEAASKPALWSDSWVPNGTKVEWGVAFDESKRNTAVTSTDRLFRLANEDTTFILGYKYTQHDTFFCEHCNEIYQASDLVDGKCPEGHAVTVLPDVTPEFQKPLVVSYDIRNTRDNSIRKVWYEFPLQSEEPTSTSTSYYDSVRTQPLSRSFDILLEDDEEFDATSVDVYNIYRAKSTKILTKTVEDGQVVEKYLTYRYPDTKVSFTASASKRYKNEVNVNSVVKYNFTGLTKFFDYSMISMNVDKVLPSYWFEGISEDVRNSVQDKIDDGSYSIRYAVYNINNSFYRLTYYSPSLDKVVTVTTAIKTPNSVVVLEKDTGNKLSYLIKNSDITYEEGGKKYNDFALENLKQLEIVGFTINIHLWNIAQSTKVGRTDLSIHFGAIDVMPENANAKVYNIFTFVLIFELVALAAYAIGSVVLFFVLKEKYKNDEFRRMKPKVYAKTAVLGYVGLLIISITVLFIIFRGGLFSNAVAVHNPIDIFIVVPGVISVVIIGYFIKFIVGKFKSNKQRKQAKKLKLNEDAVDDGTK